MLFYNLTYFFTICFYFSLGLCFLAFFDQLANELRLSLACHGPALWEPLAADLATLTPAQLTDPAQHSALVAALMKQGHAHPLLLAPDTQTSWNVTTSVQVALLPSLSSSTIRTAAATALAEVGNTLGANMDDGSDSDVNTNNHDNENNNDDGDNTIDDSDTAATAAVTASGASASASTSATSTAKRTASVVTSSGVVVTATASSATVALVRARAPLRRVWEDLIAPHETAWTAPGGADTLTPHRVRAVVAVLGAGAFHVDALGRPAVPRQWRGPAGKAREELAAADAARAADVLWEQQQQQQQHQSGNSADSHQSADDDNNDRDHESESEVESAESAASDHGGDRQRVGRGGKSTAEALATRLSKWKQMHMNRKLNRGRNGKFRPKNGIDVESRDRDDDSNGNKDGACEGRKQQQSPQKKPAKRGKLSNFDHDLLEWQNESVRLYSRIYCDSLHFDCGLFQCSLFYSCSFVVLIDHLSFLCAVSELTNLFSISSLLLSP